MQNLSLNVEDSELHRCPISIYISRPWPVAKRMKRKAGNVFVKKRWSQHLQVANAVTAAKFFRHDDSWSTIWWQEKKMLNVKRFNVAFRRNERKVAVRCTDHRCAKPWYKCRFVCFGLQVIEETPSWGERSAPSQTAQKVTALNCHFGRSFASKRQYRNLCM